MTDVVVDASAVVELVRATSIGQRVYTRVSPHRLNIPQHCAVEAVSALRGLVAGGRMAAESGAGCLNDLLALSARRHRIEPLLQRAWSLRHNLTIYDAIYVALAESLDAPLVTADGKLDTPSIRRLITVEVIG